MPQAVQAESSLSASPIAQSGGAVVATGAVTIMAQMGEHLGTVGPVLAQARTIIVDALGIPVGWLVPVLLVGIGLAVLHQRWRQRAGGWA
jgi:hypothetical protein